MLVIVVAVIGVVVVSFLFLVTVSVSMWAETPVTVAMAGLVKGEGHALNGREETKLLMTPDIVQLKRQLFPASVLYIICISRSLFLLESWSPMA